MPKLKLLVIRTDQLEKQVEFYKNLGLTFQYHRHGKGVFHYSTEIGETVFEIYPLTKNYPNVDKGTRLGFEVENLDSLMKDLGKKGVKIIKEARETEFGYFGIVEDWDGRKVELYQK